jgi:hypothetical protein
MLRALAIFLVFLGASRAQDEQPPAPEQPKVVRVDDNTFRIGGIEFLKDSRSIRIPAEVNMTEGLLEYALVHADGKIHESLLLTRVNPTHVNLAFKLLGFNASLELFYALDEDGSASGRLIEETEKNKKAARTQVSVEYKDKKETKSALLHEWITHAVSERPMPSAPWIYGGSFLVEGSFAAETSGDLIAIFTNRSSLLNYAGNDRDNDEVWIPTHGRVPPEGTSVTVVISPLNPEPKKQP